jgi:hypothetical protein
MALTRPRASQIYNLDYKQSTRAVATTNISLAGGAPSQVDGVNLNSKDRILVTAQSTASQNGLYDVATAGTGSSGTWVRSNDANSTGEIDAGMIVMVTEGATYAGTQWKLITDDPIKIGVTALIFTQNYSANSISGGTSNVTVLSNSSVTISSAGTANVIVIANTGAFVTGVVSATGNITGGNLLTAGIVNTTGNITSNNISITGNVVTGNILTNGYYYANGAVFGGGGGGGGTPSGNDTYVQFNDNGVFNGTAGLVFNKTTNVVLTTGTVSAVGNVVAGNVKTAGLISATGDITGGNVLTSGNMSATGNITGLNINSSNADLAEMYCADTTYESGTVVEFGGVEEITISTQSHSTRVAGIISTNPSYLMNSNLDCVGAVGVALTGRVPCRVVGTIAKGDRLVASALPGTAQRLDMASYQPGCIIGKSLEHYDSDQVGIIEVAVGRY